MPYTGMNAKAHLEKISAYVDLVASKMSNVAISKVGTLFTEALKANISVYSTNKNYNALPNANGTYLTACAVYEAIFGKSPIGLPAAGGVDTATAIALQNLFRSDVYID